jgi:hypothetical protein
MKHDIPKGMGTCGYWEQVFYQDDYDSDEEKCYQWCNCKNCAIDEEDCLQCDKYECRY